MTPRGARGDARARWGEIVDVLETYDSEQGVAAGHFARELEAVCVHERQPVQMSSLRLGLRYLADYYRETSPRNSGYRAA